jgi:chromodomain-helicase-DNA-binding protein 7
VLQIIFVTENVFPFLSDIHQVHIEAISKEKAVNVLKRIELFRKIHDEVIPHPDLEDRLEACSKQGSDLPDWWIAGKHDKDLLVGAARYYIVD